ncbi:hypothetical protein QS257_07170 [Terrilactibacillus sp. S3-3]|nr:hypothetical protein QS257_07170 [Terrilactibacillus sp. S3-3]
MELKRILEARLNADKRRAPMIEKKITCGLRISRTKKASSFYVWGVLNRYEEEQDWRS